MKPSTAVCIASIALLALISAYTHHESRLRTLPTWHSTRHTKRADAPPAEQPDENKEIEGSEVFTFKSADGKDVKLVLDGDATWNEEGSYGTVAQCSLQIDETAKYAVKKWRYNLGNEDQMTAYQKWWNNIARDQIGRSWRFLTKMNGHPNIIGAFAKGTIDGVPALAMPYAAGGTLRRQLRVYGGVEGAIKDTGGQIIDGFKALHEQEITHGDISLNNIVFMSEPRGSAETIGPWIPQIIDLDFAEQWKEDYFEQRGDNVKNFETRKAKAIYEDIEKVGKVLLSMAWGRDASPVLDSRRFMRESEKRGLKAIITGGSMIIDGSAPSSKAKDGFLDLRKDFAQLIWDVLHPEEKGMTMAKIAERWNQEVKEESFDIYDSDRTESSSSSEEQEQTGFIIHARNTIARSLRLETLLETLSNGENIR